MAVLSERSALGSGGTNVDRPLWESFELGEDGGEDRACDPQESGLVQVVS
jgi:hypothetical protein